MKRAIIIGLCCVIIGVSVGYDIGYRQFTPKIDKLNTQVTELNSQVDSLNTKIDSLNSAVALQTTNIAALTSEKAALQSDLLTANKSITAYESQVSSLQGNLSTLGAQVNTLQTQGTALQSRIDKILGITVIQRYDWLSQWTWELTIPLSLYVEFKDRSRPTTITGYVAMAKDPKDDDFINQMIAYINQIAAENHFSETQKVNWVIDYVQSLPYTVDSVTTGADEYPRYPIETLFDRGGDCEDTSILAAALLDAMGYDVALIDLPSHMAVGIALPDASGGYYNYNGKKYYYLETTGEGWKIGEVPPDVANERALIYPLR